MSGTNTIMGQRGTKLRARPAKKDIRIQELSLEVTTLRQQKAKLLGDLQGLYDGGILAYIKWRRGVRKTMRAR